MEIAVALALFHLQVYQRREKKTMDDRKNSIEVAALKLMRFKALSEIAKDDSASEWVLRLRDVNEILTVAGLPVIVPGEINAPEIDVIKFDKED